ncbi:MAG: divalent-cation tolerance protein CutA [Moorea sp. SIO4E2]|uniref:divalent-cation tolerance protein CutA n=1 Tax=Moorena sp. SIO4E2 TaxID=2607826 RepID=UPI0013BB9114|nr:divalent-cation tolerance protein CutA [Moorena sp. SIO4E2]NEQ06362.1 divalent-cation tolerance protein CutA [Moorena sp. SIO4E2]
MNIVLILVTCPDNAVAHDLSNQLLQRREAACVNIIPGISSVYWWEGEVESDSEVLLVIKTTTELISKAEQTVSNYHPYDTPEFVVLSAEHVNEQYAAWVINNVANQP